VDMILVLWRSKNTGMNVLRKKLRLSPGVARMNQERLPRQCKYVTNVDDVTRREYGILSNLTILSHIVLAKFSRTSREIF
jgi:hypothetical protein